jgi:hypothetical protein
MSLREVRGASRDTRSDAIQYDVRRKYCNELVIPQRMDEHVLVTRTKLGCEDDLIDRFEARTSFEV